MSEQLIEHKVKVTEFLDLTRQKLTGFFESFNKTTAETFSWLSIIVLNLATVPGFLAAKAGISDKMPPSELVILVWVGLLLYFVRSAILKEMLMVVTIGCGFALQAILLGMIFFV